MGLESLTLSETELIDQMQTHPEKVAENLGGTPFAIICSKGRRRRYQRLADYLNLQLYENTKVQREDGFVLIHAGEAPQWLPNFKT